MKPLHYRRKYPSIETGHLKRDSHEAFINDLTQDFSDLLEASGKPLTLKKFQKAVDNIRLKWDNIFNESMNNHEKLWRFFYASRIALLRNEICGAEMSRSWKPRTHEVKHAQSQ
jgi:hypothetical protein